METTIALVRGSALAAQLRVGQLGDLGQRGACREFLQVVWIPSASSTAKIKLRCCTESHCPTVSGEAPGGNVATSVSNRSAAISHTVLSEFMLAETS